MQFFARNRPQSPLHDDATSEPGGEPDEFPAHSSSLHDFENDEDNYGTKAHNLRSFSQMIMRRKKLSDRAASDFNIYCEARTHALLEFISLLICFSILQTEHVEERLALHYVLALESRELLKELTRPEQWVISDELKASFFFPHSIQLLIIS